MRIGVVPASALTAKDLRASSYVANPKRMARGLVQKWSNEIGGVASIRSPAGRRLAELVEQAIREGMAKR